MEKEGIPSGRILYVVSGGFVQADHQFVAVVQPGPQQLPDHKTDMLGGRIQVFERLSVQVQVFVIEPLFNFFVNDLLQVLEVDQIAGLRVGFSDYLHFHLVIMAVVIRIIAKPENFLVLFFGPRGVEQPVRGIEVGTSEGSNSHIRVFGQSSFGNKIEEGWLTAGIWSVPYLEKLLLTLPVEKPERVQ